MKRNVYDFDKTIYAGDSSKDFYYFCFKRHPALITVSPRFFAALLLYLFGIITKTEMKERFYYFLRKLKNVDAEIFAFWQIHTSKINGWYLAQKTPHDIIISASPEFLLRPVCQTLNVELIASIVDKHTGYCNSKNCFGLEKVARFKAKYPADTVLNFYSDSFSDAPLAEIAEKAFLVLDKNTITGWNNNKPSNFWRFLRK